MHIPLLERGAHSLELSRQKQGIQHVHQMFCHCWRRGSSSGNVCLWFWFIFKWQCEHSYSGVFSLKRKGEKNHKQVQIPGSGKDKDCD